MEDDLDEVLVNHHICYVKHKYSCYCVDGDEYFDTNEGMEYFKIENKVGENITIYDFLFNCNYQWKHKIYKFCNHSYLEIIQVKKIKDENNNDIFIIDPWFSS